MAALLRLCILGCLLCRNSADSANFSASLSDTNRTRLDRAESDNPTEEAGGENWTSAPVSLPAAAPAELSTAAPEAETPEPPAEQDPARAATASLPLPLSGSVPLPVTRVSDLCPCNVQSEQCDVNCCCDPDCSQELPLFTRCSVQKVTGDPRRCSQEAALYSLSTTPEGLSQVQASVQREVNPDVFCVQSANYDQGLSFVTPNTPTEQNFDYLFNRFVGFFFGGSGGTGSVLQTPVQGNSPGYLYGDIMQTEDEAGQRDFFRLPALAGTANCLDSNPAAFLQDQTSSCVRSFALAQDCTTLQALSLRTYTSFRIFSGKDTEANLVAVGVEAVILQSVEGTQTMVDAAADFAFQPEFLQPAEVCNQVVLQVKYTVRYGEAGQIVGVTASFVLAAVSNAMLPIQQKFQIAFVQEDKSDATLRSSGNPGYVVGLPLVAGWRTADGVSRSTNPEGSLTVLQSSADQDCLFGVPQRSPVLFGKDTVSGCTFRLEDGANCSLVSEVILGTLKGQSFPDYVASFGNSPPQNLMDWVPIENQTMITSVQGCSIPLSYHLEVKWTKYGTLENPQSQIVSVMEIIKFNTSTLPSPSTGGIVPVTSSVSFIDVSASASPGFRVAPTINAKLPFDFFFPFV
ncbi:tectonic-1 [Salminus brasiliensis]|uniref:tectonic-1 n=1 Tax=Salminus brasiliensis TaxID=930266 RepID=UPI003B83775D